MSRFIIICLALLSFTSFAWAQAAHNSVTLNWTNPATYQEGEPLIIGQVTVFIDTTASETAISGSPTTFTTNAMSPGNHVFNVVVCDNLSPSNCSAMSNTVTVTIPSGAVMIVPAVSNLSATVNP